MRKLPCGSQKGGGRYRSPYKYTKKDCRFCLPIEKRQAVPLAFCPVLDARLSAVLLPLAKR